MSKQRLRPPLRSLVDYGVTAVVAWLLLRTWWLEGIVIPCRVQSASMAPTFRGLHRAVVCEDCGLPFVCDAEVEPVSPRAVCPNCGYSENRLDTQLSVWGDGLLIGKHVFQLRRPARWDLAVFRHPGDAGKLALKRIVGLPDESVQIRDGEIFVDGQLQRKPFAAQLSTRILVHDANHEPADPSLPLAWQGEGNATRWVGARGRFAARQATTDSDPVDWLTYRHWRRVAGRPGEVREEPIHDDYGYNQTVPRREEDSRPVNDVMLTFRIVEAFGRGEIAVRATDGREEFEVRLNPAEGRYRATHNGRAIPGAQGRLGRALAGSTVLLSLFDRQFALAIDKEVLVNCWPYDPSDRPQKLSARPVAIGTQGLGLVLSDLRVHRDIYYTRPPGADGARGMDQPWQLGDAEMFVLGDNSPVSRDSRNWDAPPGLPVKLLVGKPLAVLYPMRRLRLFHRDFQVPALAEIRYIP